jgi:acetyltransferase-like isoleucine patch superfamily enzyme
VDNDRRNSAVTEDIPASVVAAGQPARAIKQVDKRTRNKTALLKELRG